MAPMFELDNNNSFYVNGTVQVNSAEGLNDVNHATDIFLPEGVLPRTVEKLTEGADHITEISLLPNELKENLLVDGVEQNRVRIPERFPVVVHSMS